MFGLILSWSEVVCPRALGLSMAIPTPLRSLFEGMLTALLGSQTFTAYAASPRLGTEAFCHFRTSASANKLKSFSTSLPGKMNSRIDTERPDYRNFTRLRMRMEVRRTGDPRQAVRANH